MIPRVPDNVQLGERIRNGHTVGYVAMNASGELYEISHFLFQQLCEADGTHPPQISESDLQKLIDAELLTTSRFVETTGLIRRFILLPVGDRIKKVKSILGVFHSVLPILSLISILVGLLLVLIKGYPSSISTHWILYGFLILLSIYFHEFGHLAAAVTYDYHVTELGLLLAYLIPIGAYVSYEDKKDAPPNQTVRIALNGILANFLLTGILLIFSVLIPELWFTLAISAFTNAALAVGNLIPAPYLDGGHALSAALGVENVAKTAKQIFSNKKRRKQLFQSLPGITCFLLLSIARIAQFIVYGIIAFDVCSIGYVIIEISAY